jgi:hypothetical protein
VSSSSHVIERAEATFDDEKLMANAGLALVGVLVLRLGLERLINDTVKLTGRVGGALPGRKLLTLVHTLMVGGTHIVHADILRAGATTKVVPHRVMAPSTIGTFLRAFTFGHLRQLDVVAGEALRRAWAMGAGPGDEPVVFDIDSTICEVHGYQKQGASFGYTKVRGYHPLLATRADTGEVVHARQRKGAANTARGAKRFVEELIPRVRRAGAAGKIIVRADSGFWSNKTIATLERLGVGYTIAVRSGHKAIQTVIATIDEDAWIDIVYPDGGAAQVADIDYRGRRLVVRRTRILGAQAQLFDTWRHHAFLTDQTGEVVEVDAFHRAHATVELAIKDLKAGAGAVHMPSGHFCANGAWLAAAVLAHNLFRWTNLLGHISDPDRLVVARTLLVRLLAIPARLVHPAGRPTLRMPARWPWATTFTTALDSLRALPTAPL